MNFDTQNSDLNQCFIGLINPKSPSNVGAVLRAAGCYGASKIFYTGKRYAHAKAYATDTKDRLRDIDLKEVEHIFSDVPRSIRKIAIELVEGATPLPHFKHPTDAIYIFGPEDGSIPQEVIDQCDEVLYVPTRGCMNLAASVNVLLYDRLAKSSKINYGDEGIRKNRDTNNRTKINSTS
ncbi:MAG: RNA methyltransferase [Aliiglaciecola sp.]